MNLSRRHFLIIGFVNFAAIQLLCFAQTKYQNIEIPIKNYGYPYNGCEPSIAINPNNKNHIAAGSILDLYHFSKDAGKTWKTKRLKSSYGVYGDPVLLFNNLDEVFYFHLSDYKKTSHLDRIVCQKSKCIHGKFNEGSYTKPNGKKVQDKHWIINNPANQHLYMTWTQFDAYNSKNEKDSSYIMFSKSTDRGNSWSFPKVLSKFGGDCLDSDNTVEGAVPAIGKDGVIVVVWTGPSGMMMQKSLDEGETWLESEKKIMDHPGGWDIDIPGFYRANGLPFLVSDMSNTESEGTLYLNWADQRNGDNDTDIWLITSNDNGESWTPPIRVNQDTTKTHQFFTNMCVDPVNGNLHFIFYDRSRINKDSFSTEVCWVSSADGGKSFSSEIISDHHFISNPSIFFGDYLDIDAFDGMIRPIWPSFENNKIKLWTALIDM